MEPPRTPQPQPTRLSPAAARSPGWLVVSIVCAAFMLPVLGFAAWAYYDATVTYPDRIDRWQAYEQLRLHHGEVTRDQWVAVARQNNWPTDRPEPADRRDILTQYVLMWMCSVIGLALLVLAVVGSWLYRRSGRRVHGPYVPPHDR